MLRGDFTAASTLAQVFAWLDGQRAVAGKCRGLAYVLVQAAPRVVVGAAQEGLALAAAGIQPRTSLQVIPHAALGHRPPQPEPTPEAAPEPQPMAVDAPAAAAAEPSPAAADTRQQPAATAAAGGIAGVRGQLQQVRAEAAAASAAATAAAAAARPSAARRPPPAVAAPAPALPPPSEIQLQVRLSNGDVLRRAFQPDARLAAVLDWLDAARTDRWGQGSAVQAHPPAWV